MFSNNTEIDGILWKLYCCLASAKLPASVSLTKFLKDEECVSEIISYLVTQNVRTASALKNLHIEVIYKWIVLKKIQDYVRAVRPDRRKKPEEEILAVLKARLPLKRLSEAQLVVKIIDDSVEEIKFCLAAVGVNTADILDRSHLDMLDKWVISAKLDRLRNKKENSRNGVQ